MDFGILLLRVLIGLLVAAHGSRKLFGWFNGTGLTQGGLMFEQLGFKPGKFFAACAGLGEFVGGLFLTLGFLTPLGSALVAAVMFTASATAHQGKGFFAEQGGCELPMLIATVAVCLAIIGPGKVALDNAINFNPVGIGWGIFAAGVGAAGMIVSLLARLAVIKREQKIEE